MKDLISSNEYEELLLVIRQLQTTWTDLSTARITKIVKATLEYVPLNFKTYEKVLIFLDGLIEWCENKKMLRLDLRCRKIYALLNIGKYDECLESISDVMKDLKRYDDKANQINLFVYESRAYYELHDHLRARTSLTSAKAIAIGSSCPTKTQAQIDLLNGMYLGDDRSYDTAVSCFIEALEGFVQSQEYGSASCALRYIVLSKLVGGRAREISAVMETRYAKKIKDDDMVGFLISISGPCEEGDLIGYRDLLEKNRLMIESDQYIFRHLRGYYEVLLDKSIVQVIEPYSHVRISFIAGRLGFEEGLIEDRLQKMILENKIHGILDHMTEGLILYDRWSDENKDMVEGFKILEKYSRS
jgi:26S proteasome regulatory subunit N6